MRKSLPIVLIIIGVLAFIGCESTSSSTAAKTPEVTMPAPKTGPIVEAVFGTPAAIDGTMDPVFAKAAVVETTMKNMGDDKTSSAKARVAWDRKFLYVYLEVKDPVLSDKSSNAWEQDSIEVYIDEDNTKPTSYKPGVAQYRVNFKNIVTGGTGADVSKFKTGVKVVPGGFNVTVAMPFLKIAPKSGMYVGFDFQTNDDGAGNGIRTGINDWANATNQNYMNASGFGSAKLLP